MFDVESWTSLVGGESEAGGSGTVFGIPLTLTFDDVLGSLPIGSAYEISWVVDATSTDVGEIFTGTDIAVSSVPVPAAVWLFGSALIGLGALKRKKA